MRTDPYHCPDHFVFERTHTRRIAAWAGGLFLLVLALLAAGLR